MTRRKRAGKIRCNETAHRRALANPTTASLVKELRIHWKSLDPVERGDRLVDLTALGCSTRGLGEELGQCATTVRRHIAIAKLPAAQREAVRNGKSAKKILAIKAAQNRVQRAPERVRADSETGGLSDEMADVVLDFCRTIKGVPERPVQKPMVSLFLERVTSAMNTFQESNQALPRFSKRLSTRELSKRTRPTEGEGEFWMEYQARWLARVISAKTPERPIWKRALQKTTRRANELEPRKTPRQRYDEKVKHLAWISQGPERRKY